MKRSILLCTSTLLLAGVLAISIPRASSGQATAVAPVALEQPAGRLFEQRIYTTAPGKLPNLNARFRDHTNYLFVKHGMTLVGYWTPVDKENTLVYVLAYASREAREKSWKGFMADPEWKRVWAKSKEDAGGQIVTKVDSTFLRPTDYSPIQ